MTEDQLIQVFAVAAPDSYYGVEGMTAEGKVRCSRSWTHLSRIGTTPRNSKKNRRLLPLAAVLDSRHLRRRGLIDR